MKIVEQDEQADIPPWAEEITLELDNDSMFVTGKLRIRQPQQADPTEVRDWNLLHNYLAFNWQKGERKNPAHIEFANASTDEGLISFVEKYGPVAGIDPAYRTTGDNRELICVIESLASVRREQRLFSTALALSIKLKQKREGDVSHLASLLGDLADVAHQIGPPWEIADQTQLPTHPWTGCKVTPRPFPIWFWRRESVEPFQVFASLHGWPGGCSVGSYLRTLQSPRLQEFGLQALALLLNAVPPSLEVFGDRLVDLPKYERRGIRGVLYWMLRRDVLVGLGDQICHNPKCGRFFAVERTGQRFCTQDCSRQERQRVYWRGAGRLRREERVRKEMKRRKKG